MVLLTILAVTFSRAGVGQIPVKGTTEAKALEMRDLLASIEGTAKESPQVFKTKEGYLRFIGAPPSTYFAVAPGTPEQVADEFIGKWRNLFVDESPAVEFEKIYLTLWALYDIIHKGL